MEKKCYYGNRTRNRYMYGKIYVVRFFLFFFLFHPSLSGYNIPKAAKYKKKKKKEICEQAMHECIAIALYNGGIGHSYTITI